VTVAYHIQDEPTGGGRAGALVLNPFWPLLGMMFAGAWLGALLFTINAIFLRGPTWRREIVLAVLMLVGAPALLYLLGILDGQGFISRQALQYTLLVVIVWKLAFAYWIFFLQLNAHALYEYFNGQGGASGQNVPTGAIFVGGGAMLKSKVIALFSSPFWQAMVV
jgi:hypothetical protein